MAATAPLATVLLVVVMTMLVVEGQRSSSNNCEDSHPSCRFWKAYCNDTYTNVLANCRVTCNTCGRDLGQGAPNNLQRVTEQERRSRLSGQSRGTGGRREEARQEEEARREAAAREARRRYEAQLEERRRLIAERERLRNQGSRGREEDTRGEGRRWEDSRRGGRREEDSRRGGRSDAARREAERREAERREAERREAQRRYTERREAERREAERREATRREAAQREAERREEARRRDEARREEERREAERRRNSRGRDDSWGRRPEAGRQTDCRDDSGGCPSWKRFCTSRYTNVLNTCRKTCGICQDPEDNTQAVDLFDSPLQGCKDDYPACGNWRKYCTKEYSNVLKYCRATCGTCGDGDFWFDGGRREYDVTTEAPLSLTTKSHVQVDTDDEEDDEDIWNSEGSGDEMQNDGIPDFERINTKQRRIPRHMMNGNIRRREERRRPTPTVVQRTYRRHSNRRPAYNQRRPQAYSVRRESDESRSSRGPGGLGAPDTARGINQAQPVGPVMYRRHDSRQSPETNSQWESQAKNNQWNKGDESNTIWKRIDRTNSQWDNAVPFDTSRASLDTTNQWDSSASQDIINQWDSRASLLSPDMVKISLSQPQTSTEVRDNSDNSPYKQRYRGGQ